MRSWGSGRIRKGDKMLKLQNALEESDYSKMVEKLSDIDLLEEEDGETVILLVRPTSLEPPFRGFGDSHESNGVVTFNAKDYCIEFNIDYHSTEEQNIQSALKGIASAPFGEYEIKAGETNLRIRRGTSDFLVSLTGRHLTVKMAVEKKISADTLKQDIGEAVFVLENVVNSIYRAMGRDFELDGRIRAVFPRVSRYRQSKKVKMEDRIGFERPKTEFKEIGGCREAKSALEFLAHGLKNPQDYEKWGIRYPKGILLHGSPGTGKTLLAKAMATSANATLYSVTVSGVSSQWYGVAEKRIEKIFDLAEKNAPSILLFDEIDSLCNAREYSRNGAPGARVVSVILQRMDGLKPLGKVIVIGTTNSVGSIDPALRRPGRFDKIIEVPLPDRKAREEIFRIQSNGKRVVQNLDYALLAKESDGFTGADIEGLIQSSLEKRLEEEISTGNRELPPLSAEEMVRSIRAGRKAAEQVSGPRMYA
jgi:transitional endoplasmic reticulum ATPase